MRAGATTAARRVLFTATLVRGHIAKFHVPYLKWFKERGWETWVAAKNDYPEGICDIPFCDCFVDIDFARSPFSTQTFVAYHQLRMLFKRESFDMVHTHTPVAGVLTRLAARDARAHGTRVVYTAHGFHFCTGAPLASWMLWYPVECLMSGLCDVLITINQQDYERARKFARCRVEYAPGVGVDLPRFASVQQGPSVREELGLAADDFAVLAVGDLTANKNHAVLVDALALLPERFKLIIAGDGALRGELLSRTARLGVESRVSLIGFREDVPALLAACDLFCMPSKREGLPVSLVEAAASSTACLTSNARGCTDVLGAMVGECTVPVDDGAHWAAAIAGFAQPEKATRVGEYLHAYVAKFSTEHALDAVTRVYESLLDEGDSGA